MQFTLVAIASLFYNQSALAQLEFTYDFESETPRDGILFANGSFETVSGTSFNLKDNGVANNSTVLRPKKVGSPNQTGVADLTSFPTSSDYSVTWKEYLTLSGTLLKKGFLLRGTGTGGYTTGIKQGYYFMVQNNVSGTVTLRIMNVNSGASFTQLSTSEGIDIPVAVNSACWFRASVVGNVLTFEYSTDGKKFTVGTTYTDTSNLYTSGKTQVVYGIGSSTVGHIYDGIKFKKHLVKMIH